MTTAYPNLSRGTQLQILLGDGATPTENFTQLITATTQKFSRSIETEKHGEIDANAPTNLPGRFSVAKMQSSDLSIAGRCDFKTFETLESWLDGNPHNVKVSRLGTGANGGGVHPIPVVLTKLDLDKADNGTVTFSAAFDGQGALPIFTANA